MKTELLSPNVASGKPAPANVFHTHYQVRNYEVDVRGLAHPVTLLNYLQHAASSHAQRLGVAVERLRERNLTWVLSRYHVQFLSYPRLEETLQLTTWPSSREGLFALREFQVSAADERPLLRATTSWALLDLASRRPVRLDGQLPDYAVDPRRALATEFPALPALQQAEVETRFRVRFADLDVNRHVNNTVYAAWALEGVPLEIQQSHLLAELEIGYRAEAFYGEEVQVRVARQTAAPLPSFLHQVRNADGRELTRLRSVWRPDPPRQG